ncbi:HisA/HisF-related TIM barrel protein [Methylomonas rapida]|uniref:HisA/HisF-related TIM barrel protein n=1 Tax=Methylomonas rapida TaxID=2963939 RepID=A0ABY7GGA6_9GAMM|nr:HisA/HisF-related TIM barrel protein [Methylomonas rapida]WAR43521.1 HisA/HisF-related TIM barrel protein [Methylomonas rapida]
MQIIPVIDLKDGQVVHAVRGDRANYQPIHHHSVLSASSHIDAVLAGFLEIFPFKRFYIADLNAITGTDDHQALIAAVLAAHPEIEFWLDDGSPLSRLQSPVPNLKQVIGTESQQEPPGLTQHDYILSLDFKNERASGPASWFSESRYWPSTVIAMTLHRVGSNNGPDFDKLVQLRQSHPDKRLVAAGGIRNYADLVQLKAMGVHTALLATALHAGAIGTPELENL